MALVDGMSSSGHLAPSVFNFNSLCPGRHLADSSVWIAVASILAAFDISPMKAADGTPIIPEEEFLSGITRYEENNY